MVMTTFTITSHYTFNLLMDHQLLHTSSMSKTSLHFLSIPNKISYNRIPKSKLELTHSISKFHNNWKLNSLRVNNYSSRNNKADDVSISDDYTGGSSTMDRIVDKLKKFGYVDDFSKSTSAGVIEKSSVDDIFDVEQGGNLSVNNIMVSRVKGGDVRFPWEKKNESGEQNWSLDSRRNRRSLAELTLPDSELRRLRNLALRIKNKTRITGAGITQQVVETIREKWKTSEVCRLKVEGAAALNMKRMHEILERKTGGLVIWRSGTSVSLYRGLTYEDPALKLKKMGLRRNEAIPEPSSNDKAGHDSVVSQIGPVSLETDQNSVETPSEVKYEDEVDELLDSLGPRYTDWPGDGPLPVDADLLSGVIDNYKPPFRLLPYGVRSTVGGKEATALRRLARVLPPHFALGRSRQHQGLAAAMIKLWQRSSIAKIALKRGVQLTTSERMAEDIKRLTGGVLLSRNKDFLVFYRGKNFLSPEVAEALMENERLAKTFQDEEEQARLRASAFFTTRNIDKTDKSKTAGTLKETLDADTKWGKNLDTNYKEKVMREAEMLRHANLVRKLEKKLQLAERKLTKAEKTLSKVEESLNPTDHEEDPESLTDEERFMFRKLGLRMKAFLLLGRRGIFGGTVENMHLHWKYRELVKIIVNAKNVEEVKNIALSLEAESGGVLVSVDKVSKGYAVIVFRGREYERPSLLRPKNLLTKRKALARSIELQRQQAILNHISTVETRVNQLRCELEQMLAAKDIGDENLYSQLDSAHPSDEEDIEEEEDESYLEEYYSEDDVVDDKISFVNNAYLETNFPYGFQEESETEFVEP